MGRGPLPTRGGATPGSPPRSRPNCTSRSGWPWPTVRCCPIREVIITDVDALPADLVDDDLRRHAQATLLDAAAVHDAKDLPASAEGRELSS